MASLRRPLQTDLLNVRSEVGDSVREKLQSQHRVDLRLEQMNQFVAKVRRDTPDIGQFCLNLAEHGAPKDFDIAKARRLVKKQHGSDDDMNALVQQRGVQKMSRAKWEELQFRRHFVDQTDANRMANVYHARRNERAVIGTNFVPDSIDDLPDCERAEVQRSRLNCVDRLNYEVRNHDYLRDSWRVFVKEREGVILAPPFGVVGPC